MSVYEPVAEHMVASPMPQDLPPVAFDVSLGEKARAEGLIYDVDYENIYSALLAGGLQEEDITRYPLVISPDVSCDALFLRTSPYNYDQPAIIFKTSDGSGAVLTTSIAHEARHLSDHLYIGDTAFVSQAQKRLRKIGVTLFSLASAAAGANVLQKLGADPSVALPTAIAMGDVTLSLTLAFEYVSRQQEKRAFQTEDTVSAKNVLIVDGAQVDENMDLSAWDLLCTTVIPNFKL